MQNIGAKKSPRAGGLFQINNQVQAETSMTSEKLIRKAKLLVLNLRLALLRRSLKRTQNPHKAPRRLATIVVLVRRRNALMTASEIVSEERKRGLSA